MHFPGQSAFDDNDFWHSSKGLPHYDRGGIYQCITYRLADSLPQSLLQDCSTMADQSKRRQLIEKYLDNGKCVLRDSQVASVVLNAWKFFHGERYEIVAYVIMPNHCHILIAVFDDSELAKIVHSWKNFTSKEINKLYPQQDRHVWQYDYWDRFIRDEKHFSQCVDYSRGHPMKEGLCQRTIDWDFSSARFFEGSQ